MAEPQWEQPAGGRSLPVVPAALAVGIAVALVVWMLAADDDGGLPIEESREVDAPQVVEDDTPTDDTPAAVPTLPPKDLERREARGPWLVLPHSPLVRRTQHSMTWTGEEVVVWGGSRPDPSQLWDRRTHLGTGGAFDPATERWRRLAPAPIPPRDGHAAVWTGEEVIVWGGRAGAAGPVGAAYRPDGGGWRQIAEGPLDPVSTRAHGAWTGDEMLVWVHDGERLEVASYEPGADTWTQRTALAVGAAAEVRGAWTKGRLVALTTGAGASSAHHYDPVRDAWDDVAARLPPAEGLAAAGAAAVAWGHRVGEHFGELWAVRVDVATGSAEPLTPPPARLAPDPVAAWTGQWLTLWDGTTLLALDLDAEQWHVLEGPPLAPRTGVAGTLTDRDLVVWGGGGGEHFYADGARVPLARLDLARLRATGHVAR